MFSKKIALSYIYICLYTVILGVQNSKWWKIYTLQWRYFNMATCFKNVNISMVQLYSVFQVFVFSYCIYYFYEGAITILRGMGIYIYILFLCI